MPFVIAYTQDRNGITLGQGSGFFVRRNLIATNYHVIAGAARGTAKLVGKYTTYAIAGFTARDKTNDLALLKATIRGIKLLPLLMPQCPLQILCKLPIRHSLRKV